MSSSLQKVEVGASLGSFEDANLLELGDLKSVFDSLLSFIDLGGGGSAFFLAAGAPSSLGCQPGYCPIFMLVFMTCASFTRCSPLSYAYYFCLPELCVVSPKNRSFVVAYCGCLRGGSSVNSLSTIPWILEILCSLPDSGACFTWCLYPEHMC